MKRRSPRLLSIFSLLGLFISTTVVVAAPVRADISNTNYDTVLYATAAKKDKKPVAGHDVRPPQSTAHRVQSDNAPLTFIANSGQTDAAVRYYVQGPNGNIFFTDSSVVFNLPTPPSKNATKGSKPKATFAQPKRKAERATTALRVNFIGANSGAKIIARDSRKSLANSMTNAQAGQRRKNTTASTLVYAQLYRNIDLVYTGTSGQLKGTYEVARGANPSTIQWRYSGVSNVALNAAGALQITLPKTSGRSDTTLIEAVPVAWQDIAGQRVAVTVQYTLTKDGTIGFRVGKYNKAYPLIIDPTLTYSTYIGGNGDDGFPKVATDQAGNIYLISYTTSSNFPTANGTTQTPQGGSDAVVTKLDPTGHTILYTTVLGGSDDDFGTALSVDSAGNVYAAGFTYSTDFPTTSGAFQTTPRGMPSGGYTGFVTKLDTSGTPVYSTYLGGNSGDAISGIGSTSGGNALVVGTTASSNFPTTPNVPQLTLGGGLDGFVTELTPSGSGAVYSTYLGSAGDDSIAGVAVAANGTASLIGTTASTNLPLVRARQTSNAGGDSDAFVAKINADGHTFAYLTYVGGSGADYGTAVALDSADNTYVTGITASPNFPTARALRNTRYGGDDDAFVTKMDSSGQTVAYSTYYGGNGVDEPLSVAVDELGSVTLTGQTTSTTLPISNAVQPQPGNTQCASVCYDAFVTRFNPMGNGLLYSTYLGGSDDDGGTGIFVRQNGTAFVAGVTYSTNFPTRPGGYQTTFGGGPNDLFLSNIASSDVQPPAAPANVHVTDVTDTTVGLAWDSVTSSSGPVSYNIYLGPDYVGSTDATTFTTSNLQVDHSYTFYVAAEDGLSRVSAASSGTVGVPVIRGIAESSLLPTTGIFIGGSTSLCSSYTSSTGNAAFLVAPAWFGPIDGPQPTVADWAPDRCGQNKPSFQAPVSKFGRGWFGGTIYALTGDGALSSSLNGVDWMRVYDPASPRQYYAQTDWAQHMGQAKIQDFVISRDGQHMYAAINSSADNGAIPGSAGILPDQPNYFPNNGFYHSDNGGFTFTQTFGLGADPDCDSSDQMRVTSVTASHIDPSVVWLSAVSSCAHSRVYTSADGGQSFQLALSSTDKAIYGLTPDTVRQDRVYMTAYLPDQQPPADTYAVYQMTGLANVAQTKFFIGMKGLASQQVAVAPLNSNEVYIVDDPSFRFSCGAASTSIKRIINADTYTGTPIVQDIPVIIHEGNTNDYTGCILGIGANFIGFDGDGSIWLAGIGGNTGDNDIVANIARSTDRGATWTDQTGDSNYRANTGHSTMLLSSPPLIYPGGATDAGAISGGGSLPDMGGDTSPSPMPTNPAPIPCCSLSGVQYVSVGPASRQLASFVNPNTGDYFARATDLIQTAPSEAGGLGLGFGRSYNALDPAYADATQRGSLGTGWRHSYEWFLREDAASGLVTLTHPDGLREVYTPNGSGGYTLPDTTDATLTKTGTTTFEIRDLDVMTSTFTDGLLQSMRDRNGNTVLLRYSASKKLESVSLCLGACSGMNGSVAANAIQSLLFSYASSTGMLATVTDQSQRVVQFDHTNADPTVLTGVIDAAGYHTTYVADTAHQNRLSRVYDPNHQTQPITATDTTGFLIKLGYDALNRVITVTSPHVENAPDSVERFDYSMTYRTGYYDGRNNLHMYNFDALYRTLSILDSLGDGFVQHTYQYGDASGTQADPTRRNHITSFTDPNDHTTRYTYDAKGQPLSTERTVTVSGEQLDKNESQQTQVVRVQTQYTAQNLPSRVTDARGNVTCTLYGPATGNETDCVSGGQNSTKAIDPLGNTVTYDYYVAAGYPARVYHSVSSNGLTTTYFYDSAGYIRTITRRFSTYTLGAAPLQKQSITLATSYRYNTLGQLTDQSDSYQTTAVQDVEPTIPSATPEMHYSYDAMGRVVAQDRYLSWQQPDSAQKYHAVTAYDNAGNVTSSSSLIRQTVTTDSYDARNQPRSRTQRVTDKDGQQANLVTLFSYDANGNIQDQTEPTGAKTTHQYDALDRVILTTMALKVGGNVETAYVRDGVGNILQATRKNSANVGSGDQTTKTFYDELDRVRLVQYPDQAHVGVYRYDQNGNLITTKQRRDLGHANTDWTDVSKVTVNRTFYDALDRATETQTSAATPDTANTYASYYVACQSYLDDQNVGYTSDPYLYTINDTLPLATKCGGILQPTIATTHPQPITATEQDAAGRAIRTTRTPISGSTDADLASTYGVYDANDLPLRTIDALGNMADTAYDTLHRTVEMTRYPDPNDTNKKLVTRMGYSDTAQQKTTTVGPAPYYARQVVIQDEAGRTLRKTMYPNINPKTNPAPSTPAIPMSGGFTTTYTYDTPGNKVTISDDDPVQQNRTTTLLYENSGWLLTMNQQLTLRDGPQQAARAHTLHTMFCYDLVGNRVGTGSGDGILSADSYCQQMYSLGNPASNDHVTRASYDTLNQLRTETDEYGKQAQYDYDGLGRIVRKTDTAQQPTTYTYDNAGHLTEILSTGVGADQRPSVRTRYTYQAGGLPSVMIDGSSGGCGSTPQSITATCYRYDGLNRVKDVVSPQGQVHYAYDVLSRRQSLSYARDPLGTDLTQVGYAYDGVGRLAALTNWRGASVTYNYTYSNGPQTTASPYLEGIIYPQTNPVVSNFAYDGVGRLTHVGYGQGGATLFAADYTLDVMGNRTHVAETRGTASTSADYTYNELNWLTTTTSSAPMSTTTTYDVWGNVRQTTTTPDSATVSNPYIYDSIGIRLQQQKNSAGDTLFNYIYDENGSVKQINAAARGADPATTSCVYYDARNRLIEFNTITRSVTCGSVQIAGYTPPTVTPSSGGVTANAVRGDTVFTYNGNDTRVSRATYADNTVSYLQDEANGLPVVLDESFSNAPQLGASHFMYAPGSTTPIFQDDTGRVQKWSLVDGLGSIRLQTDQVGAPYSGSIDYTTGGKPTNYSEANSHYFAGEQLDKTGLYYMRARYYDPESERFLQRDTMGPGSIINPLEHNSYGYANNNPTTYTDPSGHFPVLDWAFGIFDAGKLLYDAIQGNHDELGMDFAAVGIDIAAGFLPTPPGASLVARAGRLASKATAPLRSVASRVLGRGALREGITHGGEVIRGVDDAGHGVSDIAAHGDTSIADDVLEGCSLNSFSPDTLVTTEDGERPIGDLNVGDRVLAYNEETGQNEYDTIEAVHINDDPELQDVVVDSEIIHTTPHHPFYIQERGWTDAGNLIVGDHIRKADGSFGTVQKTTLMQKLKRMYNLTVAHAHTFFVGTKRWLVHNIDTGIPVAKGPCGKYLYKNFSGDWHPVQRGDVRTKIPTQAEEPLNGGFLYVITKDGEVRLARGMHPYQNKVLNHSDLVFADEFESGYDVVVGYAGIATFENNMLKSISNQSGHFYPYRNYLRKAETILKQWSGTPLDVPIKRTFIGIRKK